MPTRRTPSPEFLLTVLWFLFVLLVNYMWIKIDHRPPRWDESTNLLFSERAFHALRELDILKALNTQGETRPNFIPFLQSLTYFFLGHSTKIATFLLSSASLLVIFVSTYNIGRLTLNRWAGLFGCVFYTGYHGVLLWSRFYNLDQPLTALVSLTVLLAIMAKESNFTRRNVLRGLGLIIAVGICSKHMYALFVFLPLALLLLYALRDEDGFAVREMLRRRAPFFIYGGIGILLGLAYHAYNYETFVELAHRALAPASSSLKTVSWYSPPSFQQVIQSLSYWTFGGPNNGYTFTYMALAGLGISLLPPYRNKEFVWSWALGTCLLLFFVIKVTMAYYWLPAMPAFALMTFSFMALKVPRRIAPLATALKFALALFLCFISVSGWLKQSLGTGNLLTVIARTPQVLAAESPMTVNPFSSAPYWQTKYVDGNVGTLPYPHYWYTDEMMTEVRDALERYPNYDQKKTLGLFTNYEWMCQPYFKYKVWQYGLQNLLDVSWTFPPDAKLENLDFVITKTKRIFKNDFYGAEWYDSRQAATEALLAEDGKGMREAGFIPMAEYPLPDDSIGQVWMNKTNLAGFDFIKGLNSVGYHEGGGVAHSQFSINGENRQVIYHHPFADKPSAISYRLGVMPGTMLTFGIGMDQAIWGPGKGDGVLFKITVQDGDNLDEIFSKYIDPKNNPADRKWFDFSLPMDKYSSRTVTINFITLPGPEGNNTYDHCGWSTPRLIER